MANSIIITIPHCSARVPGKIREQIALSDAEIRDAEDFGTAEIFGAMPAKTILPAEWSRLVADLNRAPDSRGSKGIVAETDYRGRPIYLPGRYPDADAVENRIRKYYHPWHEKLARAVSDPDVKCLFDCHSLNGTAPADAPDAGKKTKRHHHQQQRRHQGQAPPLEITNEKDFNMVRLYDDRCVQVEPNTGRIIAGDDPHQKDETEK